MTRPATVLDSRPRSFLAWLLEQNDMMPLRKVLLVQKPVQKPVQELVHALQTVLTIEDAPGSLDVLKPTNLFHFRF